MKKRRNGQSRWQYVRSFFTRPDDGFDFGPDFDAQMRHYFGVNGTTLNLNEQLQAELKMRLMELYEQRKSTQRNVEMLWRAQILTAITTLISFLGVAVAAIAVIVAR